MTAYLSLLLCIADIAQPDVEPQVSDDFPLQKCVSADFQSGRLSITSLLIKAPPYNDTQNCIP